MKVIIMQGLSGSGKSTYIKNNYPEAVVCSADHYFYSCNDKGEEVYSFNFAKLGAAHQACFKKFIMLLQSNIASTIVVDNTNSTAVEISPYYLAAEAYGADVEIILINCDPVIAANRNKHGTPIKTIEAMSKRLMNFNNYKPSWWKQTVIEAKK